VVSGEDDHLARLLDSRARIGPRGPRWREVRIATTGDLVRIVEREHTGSYQYRGHSREEWELLPSLTRPNGPAIIGLGPGEPWTKKEQAILAEFRSHAPRYEHARDLLHVRDLELAVWAQHHGAPTRLLDWTLNALAALYFAVEDERDDDKHDAAVWAIAGHRDILAVSPDEEFPVSDEVKFYLPPRFFHRSGDASLDPRRLGQSASSLRQRHREPARATLENYRPKRGATAHPVLHCLGVNRETLFPDLDGLGRYLAWKHSRTHEEEFKRERDEGGRPSAKPDNRA
jgi:hypothetical protein